MKTIRATFGTSDAARAAARRLHDAGLDLHYITLITRADDGQPGAYRGNVTTADAGDGRFSPAAADVIRGEALHKQLETEFGAEADDLLQAVTEDGRSLLIAHTAEYLVTAARAALRQAGAQDVTQSALAWRYANHLDEPSSFGHTPTPRTRDLYSRSELDGSFRESEKMIDYDHRRTPFFAHYEAHYAPQGKPFALYEPAYRFGRHAAQDARWAGRPWDEVKTAVRAAWETRHQAGGAWTDVHDAVRHGWSLAA
ncbi:MAG: hypothetical protein KC425_07110 [Anaerolineales bacterium]|nr:hypothetical protein [Anaerolineales bacterium]